MLNVFPRHLLKLLILAFVYIISAKLGLLLAFEQVNTSPVWPPTGIALAALLFCGLRMWPGIFIGAFFVNLYVSSSLVLSLTIAIGNTLEAVVAGAIILHFASARPFSSTYETVVFILALFGATMISATVGVESLLIAGLIQQEDFSLLWETWWIGDLVGGLVVTPFLLTWLRLPRELFTVKQMLEGGVLLLITLSVVGMVFGHWQLLDIPSELIVFTLLPILAWSALRFHHHGATLIVLVISVAAILGTLNGYGPFVLASENESLLAVQAYMGAAIFTALLLMASQEERLLAYKKIRLSEKELENTITTRTKELKISNELLESEVTQQLHLSDALATLLHQIDRASNQEFFVRCAQVLTLTYETQFAFIGIFADSNKTSIRTLALWANGEQGDNFTYDLEGTPCADVLDHSIEIISKEAANRYPEDEMLTIMGIESYFGAPLLTATGQVIGIIAVMDSKALSVDNALKSVLGLFSNRIASELQRRKATDELELAASVFNESLEAIIIFDENTNIIRVNPEFSKMTGFLLSDAIGKKPTLIKSGQHSEEFYASLWAAVNEQGFWKGEILNKRKDGKLFTSYQIIKAVKDDTGKVKQYISIMNDITDKKATDEKIYQLAHYDLITQLPNRVAFHKLLNDAISSSKKSNIRLAVMFIDLDHFKLINDTSGHLVGDELLQKVADRLNEIVGTKYIISRFGGDEFTVVLPKIESLEEVSSEANTILDSLLKPFVLSSCEVTISASIGISIYPDNGEDVSTLLSCADNAMYRAKGTGRANYQFYTDQMQIDAHERVILERELREALKNDQFILHYQPQIDIRTKQVIGTEALIRWQHPTKGLIPPDKFIPIAETTGLIVPIGEWVIHEACRQLQLWQIQGFDKLIMAINLSARQFFQKHLLETIESAIQVSNISAENLEFEITESMMMMNVEETIENLHLLKALGAKLSIDDFGTGYSSLSYLKRFPLNKLKIDKSFIDGLPNDHDDLAIVKAIIGIAHSLKLTVIAEGVETIEQLELLTQLSCNEIQGYYFSKPLPKDAASTFLKESYNGTLRA